MQTYGHILLFAMPIFLVLVLGEKCYGLYKGTDRFRHMDMISSFTSGITNITKDVLGLSIAIISYEWMVRHFAVMQIENSIVVYLIAFVVLDHSGYWTHRINHQYNLFWNAHRIHHSSEEFDLACALRQSISAIVKLFLIFLLPAAFLGVPTKVIAIVAPLHLFAQFWYHTRHIGNMGILEKIIVTPSHHRVHHAINPEYIDKNYSQIFIFWDFLYGTFQKEEKHIPPVYGITLPAATWNPIRINFQHLALLIKDAWRTKILRDKLRIWLMPAGWRPADVEEKYPVRKITDVTNQIKYDTPSSGIFIAWCWFQLLILLGFISYLFAFFNPMHQLNGMYVYLYGLFIFLFVYALTDLMDRNRTALSWASLQLLVAVFLWNYTDGWFGADQLHKIIPSIILAYQFFSFSGTLFFFLAQSADDKFQTSKKIISPER
jgi:sterol desaturase/sphingolipid hydroxylase (fatty acid hydroxylase superfamily)